MAATIALVDGDRNILTSVSIGLPSFVRLDRLQLVTGPTLSPEFRSM
jgi:hypothetical protein